MEDEKQHSTTITPSKPHIKKSHQSSLNLSSSLTRRMSNIDIMRREVLDKDQQIMQLQTQVSLIDATYESVHKLVKDLETCTSTQLLSLTQDIKFNTLTPSEAVNFIRNGIQTLIKIHVELPQRFEQDFADKLNEFTTEIDETDKKILEIRQKRESIEEQNRIFQRTYQIEDSERNSLIAIADNLRSQIQSNDSKRQLEILASNEEMNKIRKQIKICRAEQHSKTKKNIEQRTIATAPYSKRMRDTIKEDFELQNEISKLQQLLEHEYASHCAAEEELIHTKNEIERAKQVMQKYKLSHRKEEKIHSTNVNRELRLYIEQQREDSRWAIKNQMKKNKELEKQRVDLVEEEAMLSTYLQHVEKKLAAQMLKLPDLAVIQHRNVEVPKRKIQTAVKKREIDDAEMRTIKKQMAKIHKERARARTALI